MQQSRIKTLKILLLCLISITVPWSIFAQSTKNFTLMDLDLSNYPQANAVLSVANFGGAPILNLRQDRFEVLEDGQAVTINSVESLSNPDRPISIILVLDLSGSAPLESVQAAAHQFLDHLGPEDQVALIGFNSPVNFNSVDPFKEADFTNNKDLLRDTINNLTIQPESAVYEAVHKAILNIAQETADRRAVLVMSDGYDTASRPQIADPLTPRGAARDNHIPVFTVGIFSDDPKLGRDPDYLQVLASESGGSYQEANNPDELGGLFANVVDQLQVEYKLNFTLTQPQDGLDHRLTFRITTVEGPSTIEEVVRYPAPLPVPEILRVQQGLNGSLIDFPEIIEDVILVVPDINTETPLSRVEYRVNGELLQIVEPRPEIPGTFQPWEWLWNVRDLPEGSYQLSVTAVDEAGSEFTFTIGNLRVQTAIAETVMPTASPTSNPEPAQVEVVPATPAESTIAGIPTRILRIIIIVVALILAIILIVVIIQTIKGQKQEEVTVPAPQKTDNFSFDTAYPDSLEGEFAKADFFTPADEDTIGGIARDEAALPIVVDRDNPNFTQVEMYDATELIASPNDDDDMENDKTLVLNAQPVLARLIQQGPGGKTYELREKITNIGRTKKNHIVLKEASVSREQARIEYRENIFYFYNLSETNLSKVNGKPANGYILRENDEIEIGRIKLIFKWAKDV